MDTYSPGQVADRTGFSLDTLRYYERIGLLENIARTAGGQRIFTDEDVWWLGMLRCLRDTGMPIAQMIRYASLNRDDSANPDRVALLEEHDEEVTRKLAELKQQRDYLRGKIRYYRSLDQAGGEE
jgi:DNA-binding transcriptional MerR regulator